MSIIGFFTFFISASLFYNSSITDIREIAECKTEAIAYNLDAKSFIPSNVLTMVTQKNIYSLTQAEITSLKTIFTFPRSATIVNVI